VNKTESRVELLWKAEASSCLNEAQKRMVMARLGNRISEEGVLILASEKHRSQYRNREELVERFMGLIQACLVPVKERKATRPTRASVEKRIREKKIRGDKKRSRQDPGAE
jgi:ribosome-associated protein